MKHIWHGDIAHGAKILYKWLVKKRFHKDRQLAAIERQVKFVKDKWDNFESTDDKMKSFWSYFTQNILATTQKPSQQTPLEPTKLKQSDKVDDASKQDPNEYEDRNKSEHLRTVSLWQRSCLNLETFNNRAL